MGPFKDIGEKVRPHLGSFQPYAAIDPPEVVAARMGIPPERVVKLDGNENPYGPSPRVAEALGAFRDYNIYPDPQQRRVRRALAGYAGVDSESVVAGAGSDELIDLLVRLFLDPGDKMVHLPPTFEMYVVCARAHGSPVVSVPRDELFQIDTAAVRRALDGRTKMIFVTNPNNPSGNLAPESAIREILEMGLVVVVDEAYHEFCGFTVVPLVKHYENLVVLRTMSKWMGLAGLRLGYGIMAPKLARYLLAIKTPYNITAATEVALMASLEDTDLLLHHVRLLVEERERMASLLRQFPQVQPLPSKANFVLCRLPAGKARAVRDGLTRHGVFVRYFQAPRLEDCLRITVGKPEHTDALVSALREVLKELG